MTVQYKTRMKMEHFHDFYFLQALQRGLVNEIATNPEKEFSRSVEKFSLDLDETIEDIIPNMALRVFVYLYAVCLGESRHAKDSSAKSFFLPCTANRLAAYNAITNYRPTQKNINTLIDTFSQKWRTGFGGKAWANIAKALKMYFTDPPAAFIDHVVDLEHNGGTAFNKTETKEPLGFVAYYPNRFSNFLDYKFNEDILSTRPDFCESLKVTPKVHKLVNRFSSIFGKKQVDWIEPELDRLDSYMVEWGDEIFVAETKWRDWADCSYQNSPTASTLLEECGFDSLNVSAVKADECVSHAKQCKTEAIKKADKYLNPRLESKITHKVKRWLDWALENCKVDKKAVTYQALPVQIHHLSGPAFILDVCVPYDGYGKPTKNGFEIGITTSSLSYLAKDGHIILQNGDLYLHSRDVIYLQDNKLEAFLDD